MQPMAHEELVQFALDASRDFGEPVSRELGTALSAHEERKFEDGEHKSRPLALFEVSLQLLQARPQRPSGVIPPANRIDLAQ